MTSEAIDSTAKAVRLAPAAPSWREQDAQALDTRADHVMAAIIALQQLDGMFTDGSELTTHIGNTVNLLRTEEDNLRGRANRMRGDT